MITDRWKKFAILVPLAPYLALVAVLLVAALAVTYYRWKSELRRAAQGELLNQQEAAEIAALRRGSAQAEDRAVEAEGRAQELLGKLEKLSVASGQLSVKLQNLERAAAAEKARIAVLTPAEVAAEVTTQVGPPGSDAALRHTLEIIGERNACREQMAVKDLQYANCRESLIDYAAVGEQQAKQIGDLKQALDLERRAFDKRDDLAKNQVKTAQGTWIHRIWNRVKFPVGIALGGLGGYGLGRAVAR